jgi:protein TonB
VIDKSGNINQVCLTMAAGAGLDDTLVEAVRQWKYRPYTVNGQPIDVETIIRTNFHY